MAQFHHLPLGVAARLQNATDLPHPPLSLSLSVVINLSLDHFTVDVRLKRFFHCLFFQTFFFNSVTFFFSEALVRKFHLVKAENMFHFITFGSPTNCSKLLSARQTLAHIFFLN